MSSSFLLFCVDDLVIHCEHFCRGIANHKTENWVSLLNLGQNVELQMRGEDSTTKMSVINHRIE